LSADPVLATRQLGELEQADEHARFLESFGALRAFDRPTDEAALAAFEKQLDEAIRLGRVARQVRADWLRLFRRDPAGARDLLAKQEPRLLERKSSRGVEIVDKAIADGAIDATERSSYVRFLAERGDDIAEAEHRAAGDELARLVGIDAKEFV
jgi:hypothetical protein